MKRFGKILLICGFLPVVFIAALMIVGQVVAWMYGCPGDALSLSANSCPAAKDFPGFVSFLESYLVVGFILGPIIAGPLLVLGAVLYAGGRDK